MKIDYSKVTGWFSGISWQLLFFKITACLALCLTIGLVSFREGKHRCEMDHAAALVTETQKEMVTERRIIREQIDKRAKEINDRLKQIGTQSEESVQLRSELIQIRGKLDEAINKRPANPVCAPSDDELRQYQEIAKRTRNG